MKKGIISIVAFLLLGNVQAQISLTGIRTTIVNFNNYKKDYEFLEESFRINGELDFGSSEESFF